MSDSSVGFAIRLKDTCGSLISCNITVDPFFACCPEGTECLRTTNTFCCPEGVDCREELNTNPRCADPDWPMFNNPNDRRAAGYFCCEQGLRGYNATETGGSDGCDRNVEGILGDGDIWLNRSVQATVSPTASEATSTATAEPTSSATTEPSPEDDDGPPIGAIAGGTVGGVAALAILIAAVWWFRRRKRAAAALPPPGEAKAPAVPMPPGELEGDPADGRSKASELPGQSGSSELAA